MIEVFNIQKLLKVDKDFPVERIIEFSSKEFATEKMVNIVFVTPTQIKKLNMEFRKKREVTDVLSFNIDLDNFLGEIYVCPKYVMKTLGDIDFQEQIFRLIIHGILHLYGYDHQKQFEKFDYVDEPMYIRQEEILNKFLTKEIEK